MIVSYFGARTETHPRKSNPGVKYGNVRVSYSVSESAGMMEHGARDDSHTPYESAGMIESDQMMVIRCLDAGDLSTLWRSSPTVAKG